MTLLNGTLLILAFCNILTLTPLSASMRYPLVLVHTVTLDQPVKHRHGVLC